jgi:kynurenine formamidase
MPQAGRSPVEVSAEEFAALFQRVSSWGRWGESDERGALNTITADRVAAAAGLVRDGLTTSLSWPLDTHPGPSNPSPAEHRMTMVDDVAFDSSTLRFAMDYIGVDYHKDTHSHIDALCHVAYGGALYNDTSPHVVTSGGVTSLTIEVLRDGLVGRGVLLDVPRARGVQWLEPGDHVFREDLEACERAQGVGVGEGDILLVRTGHGKRLEELGPWDTGSAKAGLHPTAVPFLAERGIAALGSDGNSDTAPSVTENVMFPIHVLAIAAMGVHLLDYLQLEGIRAACEQTGRWEFLFVGAPLRIPGGTGSPLNPIAIL